MQVPLQNPSGGQVRADMDYGQRVANALGVAIDPAMFYVPAESVRNGLSHRHQTTTSFEQS